MITKYMSATGDIVGGDTVRLRKLIIGGTAGGAATVTIDLDSVQCAPVLNVPQNTMEEVEFPGAGLRCDNLALSNCGVIAFFDKENFGS